MHIYRVSWKFNDVMIFTYEERILSIHYINQLGMFEIGCIEKRVKLLDLTCLADLTSSPSLHIWPFW